MGQSITRTCDYDGGCDQVETLTSVNSLGRVITVHEQGITADMPLSVIGDIFWCRYEPDKHPDGQYLCREHEQLVRLANGIRLFA